MIKANQKPFRGTIDVSRNSLSVGEANNSRITKG